MRRIRLSIERNVATPMRSGSPSKPSVKAVNPSVGEGCLKKRRPADRKVTGTRVSARITGRIERMLTRKRGPREAGDSFKERSCSDWSFGTS